MKKIFWTLLIVIIVCWGLRLVSRKMGRLEKNVEMEQETQIGIANPASIYCLDNGGSLQMKENKNGQYGVCYFEDNRQCEERAFYHGDCPKWGMKVTGYDNDAEAYCVIAGGELSGVGTPTPMCKRVDGTRCNAQSNMDGDCPSPYDPNPSARNVETE